MFTTTTITTTTTTSAVSATTTTTTPAAPTHSCTCLSYLRILHVQLAFPVHPDPTVPMHVYCTSQSRPVRSVTLADAFMVFPLSLPANAETAPRYGHCLPLQIDQCDVICSHC